MNKQEKNISLINQQYLKELETNNNLFNQKIKNLNNSLLNTDEKKKKSNTRHIINNSQTIDNNSIKNKFNFIQRDLNSIEYIPNLKNFTFRKKGSEKEMRDNNMLEINKELKKKIKELENENENKDNIISNLKEKLNLLNEEQNNIIFNYQKQLNTQSINNKNDDTNENYYENIDTNIEEDFKYKNENLNRKDNCYNSKKRYENDNENKIIKKYNYNKYNYNIIEENDFNNNDNNNYNLNKKKLNNLENYLSTLLKERCQLENELSEVLESPRTFSDIKLKSNINDKILINDNEIESTKNKLKKLRGY